MSSLRSNYTLYRVVVPLRIGQTLKCLHERKEMKTIENYGGVANFFFFSVENFIASNFSI